MSIYKKAESDKGILTIFHDTDACNPRENDNLGTMVCSHRRYELGDKQANNTDNYKGWAAWVIGEIGSPEDFVALPLYLYDHSGITMNTTGFSCAWDSGQVGWIYCSKERLLTETGYTAEELFEGGKAVEMLKNEVAEYDQYLTGDVYGYKLEEKVVICAGECEGFCKGCGEDTEVEVNEIDSCWGFYGSDWVKNGMKDHIDRRHHYLFDLLK